MVLGGTIVRIEVTSLRQVLASIGAGKVMHKGDASESVHWLCYSFEMPGAHARIWLSSGELNGGRYIDGIQMVMTETSQEGGASCPEISLGGKSPVFDNGLSLGASEEKLRQVLGRPSKEWGNWRSYASDTQAVKDGETWFTNSIFAVRIEGGLVSEVFVTQSTSN
jgi:hypothetical protein